MGRTWLLPVLLVLWVCDANTAEACSCPARSARCGPPADFWSAQVVFTGRVTAVDRLRDGPRLANERRVRVRILQRLRGAPGAGAERDEAIIFTGVPGLCGYPFRAGEEYLIYAFRREDGRLTTSACSRTSPVARAAVDLAYARAVASGEAAPGRIFGQLRQADAEPGRRSPLGNIPVTAAAGGTTISTTTDRLGRFEIAPTAAGTYAVTVHLPETQYALQPSHAVVLQDPRSCVENRIDVFFNGQIAGRVIDSRGRGVGGLTVSYVRQAHTAGGVADRRHALTRDDGTYRVDRVSPGAFVVSAEPPADVSGDDASRRPGVSAIARHGTLRGGERLTVDPLVLSASLSLAQIQGTVHAPDGAALPGARVFLKGTNGGHIIGAAAVADTAGRFVIAALEGERYQVFAERQPSAGRTAEFSDPVDVSVTRWTPPLRLTVRHRF
jgi:hypothetical protein